MTPITPAELDQLEEAWNTLTLVTSGHIHKVPQLIAALRQALAERDRVINQVENRHDAYREGAAEEREACAQIADACARDVDFIYGIAAKNIASAIRNRGCK